MNVMKSRNSFLRTMKIYIAGNLREKPNRELLEKVDKVCRKLRFQTYLPHKDKGLFEDGMNAEEFFKKNKEMLEWCELIVAVLDWRGISSGTAWELGYGYAKKKPCIALVEDKKSLRKEFRICVMCFNPHVELVEDLDELEEMLKKVKK